MEDSAVVPFRFDPGYKINRSIWKGLQERAVETKVDESTINCTTPPFKRKPQRKTDTEVHMSSCP